jgi:hypothetical protein
VLSFMGIHTSLISLPDPVLKNIFSFVGNKAILCKKIKEFQERRAKDLGSFIFKSHAQDDFFTKIHGKSCYRLDFSIDNISSLPSKDTWDKLKREFVDLRELRIHGSNVSLIQQIIQVFSEISHLSITIKPVTYQDTRSWRAVDAHSELSLQLATQGIEDLRNLKAIQLKGVKPFFEPNQRVFRHVERADFTDSRVKVVDWENPQGPRILGLSQNIKYIRLTSEEVTSNVIQMIKQFAPNCVVECRESHSIFIWLGNRAIETAERCSCTTFRPTTKNLIMGLYGLGTLIGFGVGAMAGVVGPVFLVPTYYGVIESALELCGQDERLRSPMVFFPMAVLSYPVTYALAFAAYKVAKNVIGVSSRVWSSVRSIFRCGRRE